MSFFMIVVDSHGLPSKYENVS